MNKQISVKPLEWKELWDAMKTHYYNGDSKWTPTTEHMWDEMLGALPPQAYRPGGFLMGEPMDHNADNEAVYACFQRHLGGIYARYMTEREFNDSKNFTGIDCEPPYDK